MTTRRNTATAAAVTDKASRRTRPAIDYVAGGGVTVAERIAAEEGRKAGAKQRLRLAAREIVETCEVLRAEGIGVSDTAYQMAETDAEGKHLDARKVLGDAAKRAKPGRGFGTGTNAVDRMTTADVVALAAYGARCGARKARPRLTEEELQDIGQDVATAILARGDAPMLPRWDALDRDPESWNGAPVEGDLSRSRWRGFAYLTARALVRSRADGLAHETAADWSALEHGAAPTSEQIAANAADLASTALLDRLAVDAPDIDLLTFTAPGSLTGPERDALHLRVSGVTRAMLAKARGVSTEAVKKSAQRGGAHLATRMAELASDAAIYGTTPEAEARRWGRDADRFARNYWCTVAPAHDDTGQHRADALAVGAPVTDAAPVWGIRGPMPPDSTARLMQSALVSNERDPHGTRLSWPDRTPIITPDSYTVPPAPKGSGTRANVPATGHDDTRGYRPVPRVTFTGTPGLPGHRYSAPTARAGRVLTARAVSHVLSTLDTWNARKVEARTFPTTSHPTNITPERVAMRTRARRSGELAASRFPEWRATKRPLTD